MKWNFLSSLEITFLSTSSLRSEKRSTPSGSLRSLARMSIQSSWADFLLPFLYSIIHAMNLCPILALARWYLKTTSLL